MVKEGWIWNLKDVVPLPYNLPAVIAAVNNKETVYIAEGEKDVGNLSKLGFTATCNSGGAGKWTKDLNKYFPDGTKVVILPDNDTAGQNHALNIAKQLVHSECKVKIVKLPDIDSIKTKAGTGAENKADISDWLAAGHSKEELLQAVEQAQQWNPEKIPETDLEEFISTLESLPPKSQTKYFKETVLPSLAVSGAVEKAQAIKKLAKILDVSMQVISEEIRAVNGEIPDSDKNQADILTEIALSNTLFHDEMKEPHALIDFAECNHIIKIGQGKDFTRYLAGEYYKQYGKSPGGEAIRQAVNVAEARAIFEGQEHKLSLRVAGYDGAFWYDLSDRKNRAVKITPAGWQIAERPPILFKRRNNQKGQAEPMQSGGDIWKLADFVNLDNDSLKLLIIYLVSALIPDIPHPIPIFYGEKGSSKSTTMQFIRQLIDPSKKDLLTMPKDQSELAQQLSGNYMPAYDNLSGISQMQSDLLCGAVTSGGVSKRKLYTDDEDTILNFFCCPVLNGVNLAASATDLLDRCLIFELRRISEEARLENAKIFADFETVKPTIFSGILNVLSLAMKLYPAIKLKLYPRMADFTRWGYSIAEVTGIGGDNFLELYSKNRAMINAVAIEEDLIATALVEFMKDKKEFSGTMTELSRKLNVIAAKIEIDIRAKDWAKDAKSLSKKMTSIKSNLFDEGIKYSSHRTKQGMQVMLSNSN